MERDNLFRDGSVAEDFTFNERVAEMFDDMLSRSVPFYAEVIDAVASLHTFQRHQVLLQSSHEQ